MDHTYILDYAYQTIHVYMIIHTLHHTYMATQRIYTHVGTHTDYTHVHACTK